VAAADGAGIQTAAEWRSLVLCVLSAAGGLRLSSSTAAALSFNEVDLDECGYDDAECLYSYSCRCGAELLIDEASLQRGIDLFPCSQCSIVYRVLYEWEPDEEEQEADAKAAMEGNADPAVTTT